MSHSISYILTRENEAGEEVEFEVEVEVSYEPPDYEDGYCTNGGGGWSIDGDILFEGKPFDYTDSEYREIRSYVHSQNDKISRDMRESMYDGPDPDDYRD
jgi:hypothetical protein